MLLLKTKVISFALSVLVANYQRHISHPLFCCTLLFGIWLESQFIFRRLEKKLASHFHKLLFHKHFDLVNCLMVEKQQLFPVCLIPDTAPWFCRAPRSPGILTELIPPEKSTAINPCDWELGFWLLWKCEVSQTVVVSSPVWSDVKQGRCAVVEGVSGSMKECQITTRINIHPIKPRNLRKEFHKRQKPWSPIRTASCLTRLSVISWHQITSESFLCITRLMAEYLALYWTESVQLCAVYDAFLSIWRAVVGKVLLK